jgi:hypothetical protein
MKVSKCVNYRVNILAKLAVIHLVFGSIISSIRIKNEKDPSCNSFLIQLKKNAKALIVSS